MGVLWMEGRSRAQVLRAQECDGPMAGEEDQSTVMSHLTQKPAELAVRAMQYSSVQGENVLDLFGGSGSTMIGASNVVAIRS